MPLENTSSTPIPLILPIYQKSPNLSALLNVYLHFHFQSILRGLEHCQITLKHKHDSVTLMLKHLQNPSAYCASTLCSFPVAHVLSGKTLLTLQTS